jgi:hypothetical protein
MDEVKEKKGNDTFLSKSERDDQSEATFLEISGRLKLEPMMYIRCVKACTFVMTESILEE